MIVGMGCTCYLDDLHYSVSSGKVTFLCHIQVDFYVKVSYINKKAKENGTLSWQPTLCKGYSPGFVFCWNHTKTLESNSLNNMHLRSYHFGSQKSKMKVFGGFGFSRGPALLLGLQMTDFLPSHMATPCIWCVLISF